MTKAILYWIRLPTHTDILSEGYVGITILPVGRRFSQHVCSARAGKYNHSPEFTVALMTKYAMVDIVSIGDLKVIRDMERELRPKPFVGWNRAIGGDGGIVKHGLTGTGTRNRYYEMLKTAEKECVLVQDSWLNGNGLQNFANDLGIPPAKFGLLRKDRSAGFTLENCIWASRSDILRHYSMNPKYEFSGKLLTARELAEIAGCKLNTMTYRLRRGWTTMEAVNGKRY